MQHSTQHQHFHLDTPQQILALHLAAGAMVQVVQGSIWLTLEGHSRDVWLRADDTWYVPLGAKAWVSTDAVAAFTVSPPVPPAAPSLRTTRTAAPRRRLSLAAAPT
jgi:quercetin dioxygenase-like cupin family protein